jgi:hypothetical protein
MLTALPLLAVLAGLVACTAEGPAENPLIRKFTWFSYVNGDDLRAECRPGAPPRYRFVYNGVYQQQVRTYDIGAEPPDSPHYRLAARVIGRTVVSEVVIGDWEDVFRPGRGVIRSVPLRQLDLDALDRSLVASGFFEPPPAGMRLRSDDFYWIAVACLGGRAVFNAYKWPSPEFDGLVWAKLLLSWDPTDVPFNQPRPLSELEIYGTLNPESVERAPRFTLTIGATGLVAR